ncbi:hypothetical protein [Cellulomonas sp. URHE0023]|uniref:hypothetical protein n=1 Tax=Cellulomonas sp. URHE0023 TaxID=1380354 RepID=UPI00054D4DDC|nr:hypothetical protein [Cellulomonas sp. URHE0023]
MEQPVSEQLVWHSWTADRAYPRHVVHANLRILLRRPLVIALVVISLLLTALALVSPEADFVGPVILAALAVAVYVAVNARVRSVLAAGATYRVALGPDTLLAETPSGNVELRYGLLSGMRVERHVVLTRDRSTKRWSVLPRGVFPDHALYELQARIQAATPITSPTTVGSAAVPSPQGPTTSYTTDGDFVRRRARAFFRTVVLRPERLAGMALVVVVTVALASRANHEMAPVWAAVMVAGVAGAFAYAYRRLLRASTAQVPVGTTYRAALGTTALWVEGPGSTGATNYSAFRQMAVRADFVFLQTRQGRAFVIYPAQLFPGTGLTDLRHRITAAAPH